jgi:hypothetical protein
MERVLWYAARRLNILVAGVVLVVGAALVFGGRRGGDAIVISSLVIGAAVLTLVSLGIVAYAWRELDPIVAPKPVRASEVYRRSAAAEADDEPDQSRAARASALAFSLLAIAGAAAVVAAAMR